MAVITRYIVVRNGVELDSVFEDKKEAEAYDKMLDAADNLSLFIKEQAKEVDLKSETIDQLSVFLAQNSPEVLRILKGVKAPATGTPAGSKPKPKPRSAEKSSKNPAKEEN